MEQLQEEKAQLAKRLATEEQSPSGAAGLPSGGPHCGRAVVTQLVQGLEQLVGDRDGDAAMEGQAEKEKKGGKRNTWVGASIEGDFAVEEG